MPPIPAGDVDYLATADHYKFDVFPFEQGSLGPGFLSSEDNTIGVTLVIATSQLSVPCSIVRAKKVVRLYHSWPVSVKSWHGEWVRLPELLVSNEIVCKVDDVWLVKRALYKIGSPTFLVRINDTIEIR